LRVWAAGGRLAEPLDQLVRQRGDSSSFRYANPSPLGGRTRSAMTDPGVKSSFRRSMITATRHAARLPRSSAVAVSARRHPLKRIEIEGDVESNRSPLAHSRNRGCRARGRRGAYRGLASTSRHPRWRPRRICACERIA
jgi:hypothetical protein